jgi:hypothetical protein
VKEVLMNSFKKHPVPAAVTGKPINVAQLESIANTLETRCQLLFHYDRIFFSSEIHGQNVFQRVQECSLFDNDGQSF